jgi:allene oxide cyclase
MSTSKWIEAMLLVVAASGAAAADTLVVIEHPDHEQVVAKFPGKDSLGNLIVFHNSIFDATGRTKIGTDQGFCVRVNIGHSYQCSFTVILPDGEIHVDGPFYDIGDSVLPITGGSGRYRTARGAMTLHPRDAKNSSYEFRYELY